MLMISSRIKAKKNHLLDKMSAGSYESIAPKVTILTSKVKAKSLEVVAKKELKKRKKKKKKPTFCAFALRRRHLYQCMCVTSDNQGQARIGGWGGVEPGCREGVA